MRRMANASHRREEAGGLGEPAEIGGPADKGFYKVY
jgi:hypothetical protein